MAASDFPDLEDVKDAVFEVSESGAVVDLASSGETEVGFEGAARDCGEEGQRVKECCGMWRVDGG